jgi:hypothetical protein
MLKLAVIASTILVAAYAATRLAHQTLTGNRKTEWPEMEKSEPLSPSELHWTIAHIRDDVGGIHALLVFTNALMAGTLAALVMSGY